MFITWALARQPALLDLCLERSLRAMAFAFGDATPFVTADLLALGDDDVGSGCERIARLIEPLDLPDGRDPCRLGMERGLATLLPALRDLAGEEQIMVAAGGLGDGRGLAASLMLGADGVMMGTRFWA